MAVNQTLKTASGSNVLTTDPDRNLRRLHNVGGTHRCLSGRRVRDTLGFHYEFALEWEFMTATLFEALRELYYSGELLYYDDGNVPPLTETFTYFAPETINFSGIEKPSGTHVGYINSAVTTLATAKADMEASEIATAAYTVIGAVADTLAWATIPSGIDVQTLLKCNFLASTARASVSKLVVTATLQSILRGNDALDGCLLRAWNGYAWVELGRTEIPASGTITWATTDPEIARSFVDASDAYIRLLLSNRGWTTIATGTIELQVTYVEVKLNTDGTIVTLTHTPVLTAGDVVWVKNLTQETLLALNTDYTISGRKITVTGQTDNDSIEVKYNRYFEVGFVNMPEEWLSGDPDSARNRNAVVRLMSHTGSVEGS